MDTVDLLDIDIQGVEREVILPVIELLSRKVKRIHIGTHGRDVHNELASCFTEAGWDFAFNFGPGDIFDLLGGRFATSDGVLSVVNPKFGR